ncbi:hypothetical protein [Flavobacterium sp. FlaQc-48]|uniref:hypothetical protein n=1 Tax=Flavobacterium sp. FlaQc-48 TaxID=3374181 RepID=UPI003757971B
MDFYTFIQLLVVSITATSAMTAFSYAASRKFRELYKEPVLLSYMLKIFKVKLAKQSETTWGWILHYLIGFLFVIIYHWLWTKDILPLSFLSALLLGAVSGIIGIIGWMIIFNISHHKPDIDFKGYYIQLFIAHVIFGIVAAAIYFISLTILLLAKTYVTV